MIKRLTLISLLLLSSVAWTQVHIFNMSGHSREYYLHIPQDLSSDAPLVFVLHGYSGSAASIRSYSGMNRTADENGFAVCYPQGTKDQWDNSFWNVGYEFHQSLDVDDVGFITELARYLQSEYNLSPQKTFCTGMSNGGDMSYLLACQASDVFSAIAPVAGCMMEWIYSSCQPSSPIPVFEIHGTDDGITYWSGDMSNNQRYGAYLGVTEAIQFWVERNNCTQSTIDTLPNINLSDGSFVVRERYTEGVNNNQVWLYKVINGGHDWPGSSGNMDISATEEIWNFFNLALNNRSDITETNPGDFIMYQNYPNHQTALFFKNQCQNTIFFLTTLITLCL